MHNYHNINFSKIRIVAKRKNNTRYFSKLTRYNLIAIKSYRITINIFVLYIKIFKNFDRLYQFLKYYLHSFSICYTICYTIYNLLIMHISYVCSSMMTVSAKFTLHTVCIVENGTVSQRRNSTLLYAHRLDRHPLRSIAFLLENKIPALSDKALPIGVCC